MPGLLPVFSYGHTLYTSILILLICFLIVSRIRVIRSFVFFDYFLSFFTLSRNVLPSVVLSQLFSSSPSFHVSPVSSYYCSQRLAYTYKTRIILYQNCHRPSSIKPKPTAAVYLNGRVAQMPRCRLLLRPVSRSRPVFVYYYQVLLLLLLLLLLL